MGDHVIRTIAFLDLCGFTALTAHRGDAAAVELVIRLRETARSEAQTHGVEIVKWLGAGVMLAAEREDAVLDCATSVRDSLENISPLRIRGGIASGSVRRLEDDYLGVVVNRAARLCAAVAPGEVAMSGSLSWQPRNAPRRSSARDLVIASLLRCPAP